MVLLVAVAVAEIAVAEVAAAEVAAVEVAAVAVAVVVVVVAVVEAGVVAGAGVAGPVAGPVAFALRGSSEPSHPISGQSCQPVRWRLVDPKAMYAKNPRLDEEHVRCIAQFVALRAVVEHVGERAFQHL